jgi:hypothetical protein
VAPGPASAAPRCYCIGDATGCLQLPLSLGLVLDGPTVRLFTIAALGYANETCSGATVAEQHVTMQFEARTLVRVELDLFAACRGVISRWGRPAAATQPVYLRSALSSTPPVARRPDGHDDPTVRRYAAASMVARTILRAAAAWSGRRMKRAYARDVLVCVRCAEKMAIIRRCAPTARWT